MTTLIFTWEMSKYHLTGRVVLYPLVVLLHCCNLVRAKSADSPTEKDIIGTWRNGSSAQLIFEDNGRFSGQALSAIFLFGHTSFSDNKNNPILFDGSGIWELEKAPDGWDIRARFTSNSIPSKVGYTLPIFVSKGRTFESNDPVSIFLWKGEEGDERYEFIKQQ